MLLTTTFAEIDSLEGPLNKQLDPPAAELHGAQLAAAFDSERPIA